VKLRAEEPARPQDTIAVAEPSFTFAGICHRQLALPARATSDGRRWRVRSA
jgi:hypothetical protein